MSSHSPQSAGLPDPVRQGEALQSVAASLASIMPGNWQNIMYRFWQVGGFSYEDVIAVCTDGAVMEFRPPSEATEGALALKDLFHEEGKGTWLSMTVSVEVAGRFRAEYNHDTEPGIPADVAPVAYLQELRRYPRTADMLPEWWAQQLGRIRQEDLDRLYAGFGADLVAAYREAGLSGEYVPPTGTRLHAPGIGPLAASDLSQTFERAVTSPQEHRSRIASGVVEQLVRSAREQGVLSALTAEGGALVAGLKNAFREAGAQASFEDLTTLAIRLPDGGKVSTDISGLRSGTAGASPEQIARHTSGFARAALEQIAQGLRNNQEGAAPDSGRLRVRLYPANAFPEGVTAQLLSREIAPRLWQTVVVDSPETLQPLSRAAHEQSGRPDSQVFAEAVAGALGESVEVSEHELNGARIVHIGAQHPYVAAHAHELDRYVGESPYGALVAFPVPEVILAHPLGRGHPVAAMDHLQQIAERFAGDAEKPISPQLYWWHPNSRGRAQGEPLDLRPVGITVDHGNRSVSLHTGDEEFAALLNSLSQQG